MPIFDLRLPPSDHVPNKQEQFTPLGREPSELLAPGTNIGGIQGRENKSRKLKLSIRLRTGLQRTSPLVNNWS